MKVENGKIIEATERELFEQYLKRGYDEIFSFPYYLERCKGLGTKIIDEINETTSQIGSLRGHWRNTEDYRIIYTDSDAIFVDMFIHGKQYTFGVMHQIYKHLDGSDEIILHKNLMDFCAIYKIFSDENDKNFHEYLKEMIKHPYDLVSIEQALIEAEKQGVFKLTEVSEE